MPSKSPAQARLMRAVAHGWKPDRIKGPTRAVAREFVEADKRRGKVKGYQFGGMAAPMGAMMRKPQIRGALDPRNMATTQPVTGYPARPNVPVKSRPLIAPPPGKFPGRGMMPGGRGRMPWRGAPPTQAEPGPMTRRSGPIARSFGGQGMGATGSIRDLIQRMMMEQGRGGGGRRGFQGQGQPGRPMMPPRRGGMPGGNPMIGGRNPYMSLSRRFGPGTQLR